MSDDRHQLRDRSTDPCRDNVGSEARTTAGRGQGGAANAVLAEAAEGKILSSRELNGLPSKELGGLRDPWAILERSMDLIGTLSAVLEQARGELPRPRPARARTRDPTAQLVAMSPGQQRRSKRRSRTLPQVVEHRPRPGDEPPGGGRMAQRPNRRRRALLSASPRSGSSWTT